MVIPGGGPREAPDVTVMAAAMFGSSGAPPLRGTEDGPSDINLSGLVDMTSSEDVKIMDGVAPAVWEGRRTKRAAAIKGGPAQQVRYYRRMVVTERFAQFWASASLLLNRSPAATLAISAAALFGASCFLYAQIASQAASPSLLSPPANVYFYDIEKGELFVHLDSDPPPIMAPSQSAGTPRGLRAYVFTCGDCASEQTLLVGYLETFDPKSDAAAQYKTFREILATHGPNVDAAAAESKAEGGRLVATREGKEWFTRDSPEGQDIVSLATKACANGDSPRPCQPPVNK